MRQTSNLFWLVGILAVVGIASKFLAVQKNHSAASPSPATLGSPTISASPPTIASPTPQRILLDPNKTDFTWCDERNQRTPYWFRTEATGPGANFRASMGSNERSGSIAAKEYWRMIFALQELLPTVMDEEPQGPKRQELTVRSGQQTWAVTIGNLPGPAGKKILDLMNSSFPGWEAAPLHAEHPHQIRIP